MNIKLIAKNVGEICQAFYVSLKGKFHQHINKKTSFIDIELN